MSRRPSAMAGKASAVRSLLRMVEEAGVARFGGQARLLESLRLETARPGRMRSPEAMRQAWWRWIRQEPISVPSRADLAGVVVYALRVGLLDEAALTAVEADLVGDLLGRNRAPRKRRPIVMEASLRAEVSEASHALIEHLERRLKSSGLISAMQQPPAETVSTFAQEALVGLASQLVKDLRTPRDGIVLPEGAGAREMAQESYLRLHEGWPNTLRAIGTKIKDIVDAAASEIEALERRAAR